MVFAFAGDSTITKFFAIMLLFVSQKYMNFLNIAFQKNLKVNSHHRKTYFKKNKQLILNHLFTQKSPL
jgi:hypothetical protein